MNRSILLTLLLALLAGVTSCAKGPPFEPLASIPPDKALVYIYRPNDPLLPGRAYVVHAGDRPIVRLIPGGYIWFLTSRRELEFWAQIETRSSVTLDLEPGHTYYLKGELGPGLLGPRPKLTPVPEILGMVEIRECKLFGAPET